MKHIIHKLCFGLLLLASLSQASDLDKLEQLDARTPLLKPSEAVELAKAYLKKEMHFDMRKYKLAYVSFSFYSEYESKKKYSGEWNISFEMTGSTIAVDSDLNIEISNDKTPRIRYRQVT